MPSPITNIMGAAIAPLAQSQTTQAAPKTQPGVVPQSQMVVASQAAAEKATAGVKKQDDRQRAVQFRKPRVEGSFTEKEVKGKGTMKGDEEDLSAKPEELDQKEHDEAAEHKVDLVA